MTKKLIGICCGRECCHKNKALWSVAKDCKNKDITFEEAQCLGECENGPNIRVDENGERKKHTKQTQETIQEHIS